MSSSVAAIDGAHGGGDGPAAPEYVSSAPPIPILNRPYTVPGVKTASTKMYQSPTSSQSETSWCITRQATDSRRNYTVRTRTNTDNSNSSSASTRIQHRPQRQRSPPALPGPVQFAYAKPTATGSRLARRGRSGPLSVPGPRWRRVAAAAPSKSLSPPT